MRENVTSITHYVNVTLVDVSGIDKLYEKEGFNCWFWDCKTTFDEYDIEILIQQILEEYFICTSKKKRNQLQGTLVLLPHKGYTPLKTIIQ